MTAAVVHPGDALHPGRRLATVLILGVLVALGPFTIDLYLPAFPSVRSSFGVSDVAIQLTLSGTVVGFALGQLLVGPWSDRVGRRWPLLVTTIVHVTACLLAAVAPNVAVLGVLRVLQGAGAAGGGVVAQAMIRDLFGGRPLVKMLARMGLVSGAAPVLAPLIGSQLLRVLDWRGLFVSLALYGVAGLAAASVGIGETRHAAGRPDAARTVASRYRAVLTDRVFVGAAVVGAMQFSGLFAYLATSSFLFQEVYRFTPQQYGLLFATNSVGVICGSQAAARVMRRFGPQWILAVTTAVQAASGLAILLLGSADAPLPVVLVPLWLFIAACGFGFPSVQVLGLAHHGDEAGTAASLLGAVNFGIAGLLSPLVGLLGIASGRPMGLVMAVTAAIGIAGLWLLVRPRTVPPIGS
ncbi:multidrug effflux MFS transporter [Amnibacterium sp.]|uniref:multidrug effflux MFS transporter n=1 Tax=Amnibacterium sp. TaxID=1872496 RepID=UPI002634B427|nr:multidrug effflux MFS transporter [Amnibacterium sp.]MCU1475088.1 Bcr/CflA family drug resistance efflux transporter [Amnibacterium sp.]